MNKPTLVIMAAGMGSRYGGLKQIDPVGPSGELIIDYSIYDAVRAGFGRAVFIIKKEIEALFREMVGDRIARILPVDYVFQSLTDMPDGHTPPEGRTKPWGTAHAVYCCRDLVREPFAVINADDFYGADAFMQVASFLKDTTDGDRFHYCMAGYNIENTLTEHGHVARGVCGLTPDGFLAEINERTRIERREGEIVYQNESGGFTPVAPGTAVSMNLWGFTPGILAHFEQMFVGFLQQRRDDLTTAEFFLPSVVDRLLRDGKADVRVLRTGAKWYGVTYREDKEQIQGAIRGMIDAGMYPERLWA